MNFLSKTLGSFTGNANQFPIPYTVKDEIPNSRSIWKIYNGVNPKSEDSPVTIFSFDLTDGENISKGWDHLAKNSFKKLKSIKFPGILSTVDFIDTDKYIFIITEAAVPLEQYLQQNSEHVGIDAKLYGIYNVSGALSFINTKCQCEHGGLGLYNDSVFVNTQGDWKLFGFELTTNLESDPHNTLQLWNQRYPSFKDNLPEEVEAQGFEVIKKFPFKLDSYKLGAFIFNVFNGGKDKISVNLQSPGEVPRQLVTQYRRLVSPKANLRISIEAFLKETQRFFESNKVFLFNKHLEEIKFQNDLDKLNFFKFELGNYIGDASGDHDVKYAPGFLEHKLLPELISQYNALTTAKSGANYTPEDLQQRQETSSILLNYILKFGDKLNDNNFNKTIKPIILNAFQSADRSVRLILLTHLPSYSMRLNEQDIQSKVFYNIISGFQDTNFMIRETTLTSIITIIDKVSVKQVNQDLLKMLAKSQMDPKPSIRTNTLVLIIKISDKIYSNSRNNVLITALSKSLRDSFIPCKMTALSGFEKLIDQFSLEEICSKVLGHLAVSLMDGKSYKVRQEAKRLFELYLRSVEVHASTLPQVEEDEDAEEKEFFKKHAPQNITLAQEVTNASSANTIGTAAGSGGPTSGTEGSKFSFGWGMVNKLVSSSAIEGQLNSEFNSSTPDLTRSATPSTNTNTVPPATEKRDVGPRWTSTVGTDLNNDDFGDGWGDDFDDESAGAGSKGSSFGATTQTVPLKGISKTGAKPLGTSKLGSQTNSGTANARKTSSLKLGKKTEKATKKPGSTLKLDLQVDDDEEDGWGGW